MDQLFLAIFSEKGLIYGLFTLTFFLAIFKGIPYAVSKFEAIVKQFAELTERQHSIYENTLKQISENFINQIALSNEWHKTHNEWQKTHNERLDRMEKNIEIIVKK